MKKKAAREVKHVVFKSNFAELSRIRDYILENARAFGFTDDEAYKISLAVDEACSNLIRHAFMFDDSRTIQLFIETTDNSFIVNIVDDGSPFNPLEVPLQNMKEYMEQMKRGGLGIHLMRSVMDNITYYPSNKSNPQNILKLQKTLN